MHLVTASVLLYDIQSDRYIEMATLKLGYMHVCYMYKL